jgi:hypothetical protein
VIRKNYVQRIPDKHQIERQGGNKMKKNVFVLAVIVVLISLLTLSSALAAGKNGPAGKSSNVGHLYLYEKTPQPLPSPDGWPIVAGGAWGKMIYNLSGNEFEFVFNGHKLPIGQGFSLISYQDPWPGSGSVILGTGVTNGGGNVHIQGTYQNCLPVFTYPSGDEYAEQTGSKIWLVLSRDMATTEGGGMVAWTPDAYLFESALINFDCSSQ